MSNANTNSTAPGERLIRSMTNVKFGHQRPPDEPAPEHVVALYRALNQLPEASNDLSDYIRLSRALKNHRSSCYVVDGVRLQWYTEPHGTRREYLKIEEIQP